MGVSKANDSIPINVSKGGLSIIGDPKEEQQQLDQQKLASDTPEGTDKTPKAIEPHAQAAAQIKANKKKAKLAKQSQHQHLGAKNNTNYFFVSDTSDDVHEKQKQHKTLKSSKDLADESPDNSNPTTVDTNHSNTLDFVPNAEPSTQKPETKSPQGYINNITNATKQPKPPQDYINIIANTTKQPKPKSPQDYINNIIANTPQKPEAELQDKAAPSLPHEFNFDALVNDTSMPEPQPYSMENEREAAEKAAYKKDPLYQPWMDELDSENIDYVLELKRSPYYQKHMDSLHDINELDQSINDAIEARAKGVEKIRLDPSIGSLQQTSNRKIEELRKDLGLDEAPYPESMEVALEGQPISEKIFRLIATNNDDYTGSLPHSKLVDIFNITTSDTALSEKDVAKALGGFDHARYSELSDAEKMALYAYTNSPWTKKVNKYLRKLDNAFTEFASTRNPEQITDLMTSNEYKQTRLIASLMMTGLSKLLAAQKASNSPPLVVSRGSNNPTPLKKGDIFYDAALTSTANTPNHRNLFTSGANKDMLLWTKQGIDVTPFSGFTDEREILVFPGTLFKVDITMKDPQATSGHIVTAREIDKTETPLSTQGHKILDQSNMLNEDLPALPWKSKNNSNVLSEEAQNDILENINDASPSFTKEAGNKLLKQKKATD